MAIARRTKTTEPSIRMEPGRVHRGGQPLNRGAVVKRRLILLALLVLTTGVLLQQNRDIVAETFSRPVTKVRMDNQWQHVSEQEIGNLLTGLLGAGFFNFDVEGTKLRLEQHPWIRHAAVKKIWPDTLVLSIQEEVAIARWSDGQLLNQYGEVFRPPGADQFASLPMLSGPAQEQIKVMEQYRALSQQLFSAGLRVTALSLSQRGNWTLELNREITVTAGREQVSGRLGRFIDFYRSQQDMGARAIVSVDLRYDNGLAIKRAEEELAGVAVR